VLAFNIYWTFFTLRKFDSLKLNSLMIERRCLNRQMSDYFDSEQIILQT